MRVFVVAAALAAMLVALPVGVLECVEEPFDLSDGKLQKFLRMSGGITYVSQEDPINHVGDGYGFPDSGVTIVFPWVIDLVYVEMCAHAPDEIRVRALGSTMGIVGEVVVQATSSGECHTARIKADDAISFLEITGGGSEVYLTNLLACW